MTHQPDPEVAEDQVKPKDPETNGSAPQAKPDIVSDDGVIRLSKKRKEYPVEIEDEDGGVENFVLRELTGKQRDKYLNDLGNRTKVNREGKVIGVSNFDGLQASLLVRSLFRIADGGKLEAVKDKELQEWPAALQTKLFDKAKEMSGLNEMAETDAKND